MSGHTDVVSIEGQNWSSNPFQLVERNGKLFARGAADMKGFVACAIAAACRATRRKLNSPMYLALSYDEELGCVGAVPLMEFLQKKENQRVALHSRRTDFDVWSRPGTRVNPRFEPIATGESAIRREHRFRSMQFILPAN